MNKHERHLMVFVRNLEKGKVKTRLAAGVGDDRALEIYKELLEYTKSVISQLDFDISVHYSNYVDTADIWENNRYRKLLQSGNDLGACMLNAFSLAFQKGYRKVAIIGSDCAEITKEIIEDAFLNLDKNPCGFGPAVDGGYYLLAKSRLIPQLFSNKVWSKENVLLDSLNDLKSLEIPYSLLPTLSDIDTEEDLHTLYSNK